MSIVDNKQHYTEKRKPLKEIKEVPVRDQIVKSLFKKSNDLGLGSKIRSAWSVESANVANALEMQRQFMSDTDDFLVNSAEGEFEGNNNLKIPMPHIVSKAYVARFFQALWSIDPPFTVKARREDGADKVDLISDTIRYTIFSWANYYQGIEEVVEKWIYNWVNSGTGIMKLRWHQEYCSYMDAVPIIQDGLPQVMQDADGNEFSVPTKQIKEVETKITLPKFEGPCADVVQPEDFIMVGGEGDPDRADMIIHRYWMTESELWAMVDTGKFDEEAVEDVIKSGGAHLSSALNNSIKVERAENAGKSQLETGNNTTRYEILEAYVKACVDDSGMDSDLIQWVANINGKILRSTYLYRVIPTGERPFSVIHFHKRPGQENGVGLLELLHPLAVELNALHNIKLDIGMITANPIFFYKASSSLQPEKLQLEPGMGVPVDDPQNDVVFPNRPQNTGFFGNEEMLIQSYIEKLTGISDISLGAMSGSQGAARTATGARAMMSESNTNLDIHLRHLTRGWKKVLGLLFHMLQQRIDGEFCFRITGSDGSDIFRKVASYDLIKDVDFEVAANSASSNRSVQIENAQQLMSITANPLYLQLGLTGPGQAYEAVKFYLNSLGIKDVHRFIMKPKGYTYNPSPEEIFNRSVRGQEVQPNPTMDIDGIIAFFDHMIGANQDPQKSILSHDQLLAAISTMRQFQQMKQSLEQQQNQVAVNNQMRSNAAQSALQAPTGMNPLEGMSGGVLPGGQA